MSLLNYTTTIAAQKTAGEIQGILAGHGAKAILMNYADGEVESLSFKVMTIHGEVAIRLPVDPDAVLLVMQRGRTPQSYCNRTQAVRVAWRIVKSWVQAQMALIETDMVRMEQVFLPYWVVSPGRTLYDHIVDTKFQLPGGEG